MGRGSIYYGRESKYNGEGGQNTMSMRVDILWLGGSKYHEYGRSKYHV